MRDMTDATEHATFPKSTKSTNSGSSLSRGTNSDCDFGLVCKSTAEFEFLDCGLGGFRGCSIFSVVCHVTHLQFWHDSVAVVTFFLMGTVALYRVCSTGLR